MSKNLLLAKKVSNLQIQNDNRISHYNFRNSVSLPYIELK